MLQQPCFAPSDTLWSCRVAIIMGFTTWHVLFVHFFWTWQPRNHLFCLVKRLFWHRTAWWAVRLVLLRPHWRTSPESPSLYLCMSEINRSGQPSWIDQMVLPGATDKFGAGYGQKILRIRSEGIIRCYSTADRKLVTDIRRLAEYKVTSAMVIG